MTNQPSNELERVLDEADRIFGSKEFTSSTAYQEWLKVKAAYDTHITQDKERGWDNEQLRANLETVLPEYRRLQSQLTELREATGQRLWELGAEELKRVQRELAELREELDLQIARTQRATMTLAELREAVSREANLLGPYDPVRAHRLRTIIQNQESVKTD